MSSGFQYLIVKSAVSLIMFLKVMSFFPPLNYPRFSVFFKIFYMSRCDFLWNYKRKGHFFFFSYFGILSLTSCFASAWVTRTISSYSLEVILQHFNDSYFGFSYLCFYSLLFHSLTLWLKHSSQALLRLGET